MKRGREGHLQRDLLPTLRRWFIRRPTLYADVSGASRLSWNGLVTLHPHAIQQRPSPVIRRRIRINGNVPFVSFDPRPNGVSNASIAFVSRASSWTLDKEVFEQELALTTVQRATTTKACYFAVRRRSRQCLDPNDFVFRPAVGAIK
jgi:hypothetical protein